MLNVPQEEEYSQEKSSPEGPWDRGQECLMRQAFPISCSFCCWRVRAWLAGVSRHRDLRGQVSSALGSRSPHFTISCCFGGDTDTESRQIICFLLVKLINGFDAAGGDRAAETRSSVVLRGVCVCLGSSSAAAVGAEDRTALWGCSLTPDNSVPWLAFLHFRVSALR